MKSHKESGFTFVEVAVVLVILGMIANLLVPYVQDARSGADAARVMNDLNTLRLAGFDYYATTQSFPSTSELGQSPAELASYLPPDFEFEYNGIYYNWLTTTWQGTTVAGPVVVAPPHVIDRCDTMQAHHRVVGPSYLWLLYEL